MTNTNDRITNTQPSFHQKIDCDILKEPPSLKDMGVPEVRIYSEFPLTYYGGGERLILMIYQKLRQILIQVSIVENTSHRLEKRVPEEIIKNAVGSDLKAINFHRFGFPGFLYQDIPPLDELTFSSNSISLIFARRIPPRSVLRKLKTSSNRFIFCLHGIALERFRLTLFLIMVHQVVVRFQLRTLSHFADRNIYIQCLTPNIVSYLQGRGANERNIFLIENQFSSNIVEIKMNNDFFKVIFIGRFNNLSKGINFLSNVIRNVNRKEANIEFVIIGTGPDHHIINKVEANVRILGNVTEEEKTNEMMNSNLGIITSNLEPYPRVALEFLTSGIPIVSTPTAGPSHIIGKDEFFGKISSFRAEEFAEDILNYYNAWHKDKLQYYDIRLKIAERAKEMFKVEEMLDMYSKMIFSIAKGNI